MSIRVGREGILAAAREEYARSGPDGLTMRSVARRAGVTATAIYHHYEGRDELVRAVIRRGFETFQEFLQPARSANRPLERLAIAAERYVEFALAHPRDYRTMFLTPGLPEVNRYPEDLASGQGATFALLVEIVEAAIEAGEFPAVDPAEAALHLWASLHGLVSLYLVGRISVPPGEFRSMAGRHVRLGIAGLAEEC